MKPLVYILLLCLGIVSYFWYKDHRIVEHYRSAMQDYDRQGRIEADILQSQKQAIEDTLKFLRDSLVTASDTLINSRKQLNNETQKMRLAIRLLSDDSLIRLYARLDSAETILGRQDSLRFNP